MTPDRMKTACALLVRHWREGTTLEALPPEMRPADRAQAYRVQAFLSRHGLTLKAGQVVTTGTCVTPVPLAAGDVFVGDLGVLGRVSVRIT